MNVLICSIIRNESKFLDQWYAQIKAMVEGIPDVDFHVSVVENDSTDDSAKKLMGYDWSFTQSHKLSTARFNTPNFVGGAAPERVNNLAYARNSAMYHFPGLAIIDYVLFVEADITYTVEVAEKIINHEKHYGKKLDVFCGKSVHHDRPGPHNIYDSWGTRKTANQPWYLDSDGENGGFEKMWSVFNCAVLYNAEPIKKGACFGGVNPRTGQPDCDTVVICENFHKLGHDQIYWDTNLEVKHVINDQ